MRRKGADSYFDHLHRRLRVRWVRRGAVVQQRGFCGGLFGADIRVLPKEPAERAARAVRSGGGRIRTPLLGR
jgi:hypothetical protein